MKYIYIYTVITTLAYFYITAKQDRVVMNYILIYLETGKREIADTRLDVLSDTLALVALIPGVRMILIGSILITDGQMKKYPIVEEWLVEKLYKSTRETTLNDIYNEIDNIR